MPDPATPLRGSLPASFRLFLAVAAARQGNKAKKVIAAMLRCVTRLMPHLCSCCAEQGGAEGFSTASEGACVPKFCNLLSPAEWRCVLSA